MHIAQEEGKYIQKLGCKKENNIYYCIKCIKCIYRCQALTKEYIKKTLNS